MRSASGAAFLVLVFLIIRSFSCGDVVSALVCSSCFGIGVIDPGPSSKLRFLPPPLVAGIAVTVVVVASGPMSEAWRFAAGVEKKLEALRFCCGCDPFVCDGLPLLMPSCESPFVCAGDSMKLLHPESMWLLISEDLTGWLQIGQSTAMVVYEYVQM